MGNSGAMAAQGANRCAKMLLVMPRFLYTVLLCLLLPLVPLRLLWRSFRQPEYLQHLGERFGFFGAAPTGR
jgi:hypothetical protein